MSYFVTVVGENILISPNFNVNCIRSCSCAEIVGIVAPLLTSSLFFCLLLKLVHLGCVSCYKPPLPVLTGVSEKNVWDYIFSRLLYVYALRVTRALILLSNLLKENGENSWGISSNGRALA